MFDGDRYDTCCRCGTEFLVKQMWLAGFGLYECAGCHERPQYEPDDDSETEDGIPPSQRF